MDTGSPGSLWVLHLRSAESDPGPIARTTLGTDHICGLRILQGQNRLGHDKEAVCCAHTQAGPGLGWARQRTQTAAQAAAAPAVG